MVCFLKMANISKFWEAATSAQVLWTKFLWFFESTILFLSRTEESGASYSGCASVITKGCFYLHASENQVFFLLPIFVSPSILNAVLLSLCVCICNNILKSTAVFLPSYLHSLFPELISELLYNGFCFFTEWQEAFQGRSTSFQSGNTDNSLQA